MSDAWQHPLAVTRRSFERQISTFRRRGFRPIPADALFDGVRRGLHVTFDDAFRDVLDIVPLVERFGLHATVFPVTSFADSEGPFDVPELANEGADHPERLSTMRWSDLAELAARGFEIGSHTATHPHLTTLTDAELDSELGDSRTRIEDELKQVCRLLAYPYGEHDERVQSAAQRCGYTAAFGLSVGTERSNRYALPRIDFYRRDSLPRAILKTTFLKPHASAFLARVRRLS
ncbi:MAG: polysaccharide deacetylase family protein [Actinomycetota bacterium]